MSSSTVLLERGWEIAKYKAAGVKHIFQGGEKHDLTGLSYTSCANHDANLNAEGTRVVSCNTTGLSRTWCLLRALRLLKVECTMIRRATDPGDSKGPINAIKPVLKVQVIMECYDRKARN